MQKNRKNSSRPYLVPALERGLKVLEMLSAHPEGLLMSEMKELQLPAASLYRILVTLTELGYIVRDGNDRCRIGRKLLSLGYKGMTSGSLAEEAAPFLRNLRRSVNETVALGVLFNGEGVVIDTFRSEQPVCVFVQVGHRFPLHSAAPGKAILAFLPEEERDALLENMTFESFNERTITDKQKFLKELDKVRGSGTAYDMGEESEDLRCVAAPVFDSRNVPVAAVWVTGPASRLDEKKLQAISLQVRETAEKIGGMII